MAQVCTLWRILTRSFCHCTKRCLLFHKSHGRVFRSFYRKTSLNTSISQTIEGLLKSIPQRFVESSVRGAALGSVLCASLASLASCIVFFLAYTNIGLCRKAGRGGQIICFQSSMPTIGSGALGPREEDESILYGTEKEKTLFAPRNSFWRDLGEECAEEGIGVSIFLAPSHPMDLGSIGELDRHSVLPLD